ncbi:hypothetical protein [Pseudomonas borbori]|uniref:Uncharacterized protein n=1 Tax=Pseudomonas borbori TaxID=289003 RepID=A0A1I5XAV5_9PSED|nr:hypothetical protein [Pseudomonas borbori]SFQ29090.1 hypothetical protein SAMN05216190_1543 [Pseudomonas borbori]
MQMRPDIQLTCITKAMLDVVIPAVDPNNQLAVEQSQLVVRMLNLMAMQLPLQFRFDRDELQRLVGSAAEFKKIQMTDFGAAAAMEKFSSRCALATDVLEKCQVDPAEILYSIKYLREAMASIVSSLAEGNDEAAQLQVEKVVLNVAREQLLRDRSLMATQGWEADPTAIPNIESLLGVDTAQN